MDAQDYPIHFFTTSSEPVIVSKKKVKNSNSSSDTKKKRLNIVISSSSRKTENLMYVHPNVKLWSCIFGDFRGLLKILPH